MRSLADSAGFAAGVADANAPNSSLFAAGAFDADAPPRSRSRSACGDLAGAAAGVVPPVAKSNRLLVDGALAALLAVVVVVVVESLLLLLLPFSAAFLLYQRFSSYLARMKRSVLTSFVAAVGFVPGGMLYS